MQIVACYSTTVMEEVTAMKNTQEFFSDIFVRHSEQRYVMFAHCSARCSVVRRDSLSWEGSNREVLMGSATTVYIRT